jgi:predicted lipase
MQLPTDSELVDLCAATYAPDAVPYVEYIDNAVRAFVTTRPDGFNIIAIEGTHNLPGWMLDFFAVNALSLPVAQLFCTIGVWNHPKIEHPQLGLVHAGFDASAMIVLTKLAPIAAKGPFAVTGHSLGAAIAERLAAEFVLDGTPPAKVALFAPPRVGGAKFVAIATSVPTTAYKYGDDPVPQVPFTLPDFPYQQVPLTQFGTPMIDAFACHNVKNYVAAVHALASGGSGAGG